MKATISRDGAVEQDADREAIAAACQSGTFFWLDLESAADDGALTDVLLNTFHFHPLAVEDAEHFGQRPKLDTYDDYVYLVVHGASDGGDPPTVEMHLFLSPKFVVTVHRQACPVLDDVRQRLSRHHAASSTSTHLVVTYLVVDALTDTFFPVLSSFDDTIDTLEGQILKQPTEEQLGTIFDMKRQLVGIRKVITPQRDVFAALSSGVSEIPGMDEEGGRYFRDLYDHLIRISDTVDNYRDLLTSVMDTHISTVSNRLNVVMKQLAIIATVFLPLSFLTGFFGQNFAILVSFIGKGWTFWAFGVGAELVAVVLLMILFKRRGWLGGPTN